MLCLNVYKRHHPDSDKLKDGRVECTRCEAVLYELESGGRRWVQPDGHLGAELDA